MKKFVYVICALCIGVTILSCQSKTKTDILSGDNIVEDSVPTVEYCDTLPTFVETIVNTDTIYGYVFGKDCGIYTPDGCSNFTPSEADIKTVENIIANNFDKIISAAPAGNILNNREVNSKYFRQYAGYIYPDGAYKILIICRYCPDEEYWNACKSYFSDELYLVEDGGEFIWEATINISSSTIEDIYIHHEA